MVCGIDKLPASVIAYSDRRIIGYYASVASSATAGTSAAAASSAGAASGYRVYNIFFMETP